MQAADVGGVRINEQLKKKGSDRDGAQLRNGSISQLVSHCIVLLVHFSEAVYRIREVL